MLLFDNCFSTNETESDKLLEMSSKLPQTITVDQQIILDEDNEAEISQYLTLAQLGNILRELSVKGKAKNFTSFDNGYISFFNLRGQSTRLRCRDKYCLIPTYSCSFYLLKRSQL